MTERESVSISRKERFQLFSRLAVEAANLKALSCDIAKYPLTQKQHSLMSNYSKAWGSLYCYWMIQDPNFYLNPDECDWSGPEADPRFIAFFKDSVEVTKKCIEANCFADGSHSRLRDRSDALICQFKIFWIHAKHLMTNPVYIAEWIRLAKTSVFLLVKANALSRDVSVSDFYIKSDSMLNDAISQYFCDLGMRR